jgi:hypothetical protein
MSGFFVHVLSARQVSGNIARGSKLCVRISNPSKKAYVTDIGILQDRVEWDYLIFVPVDANPNCVFEIDLIQDQCLKSNILCSCKLEMGRFMNPPNSGDSLEYMVSAKLFPKTKTRFWKKWFTRKSRVEFDQDGNREAVIVNMTIRWIQREKTQDEQDCKNKKKNKINLFKKSMHVEQQQDTQLLFKHSESILSFKNESSVTDSQFVIKSPKIYQLNHEDSLSNATQLEDQNVQHTKLISQNLPDNNLSTADASDLYYQESYVLPEHILSESESAFERWSITPHQVE